MRIAQVAPLFESVPPVRYGGTERIVSYLTEELVREGHDVTLFASGDSVSGARIIAPCPRSLRLDKSTMDGLAHHILEMEWVFQRSDEFDVIHYHVDYMHYPVSRRIRTPHVTTLHGRLDIPDLVPLYREFSDIPLVSISDSQRKPLPFVNWCGTVYHGFPRDLYSFHPGRGEYLAFLGRVSPEKGCARAIGIAKAAEMPLRIAAKVDDFDKQYFDAAVKPLLDHPLVEFLGEIDDGEKDEFLGNAHALLFPIEWPEPFGMVMIESIACGTPVIAYRDGSVPELMEDGGTGFIVNGPREAVEAIRKVPSLSRARCREVFEERFSSERMAAEYLRVYRQLSVRRDRRAAGE